MNAQEIDSLIEYLNNSDFGSLFWIAYNEKMSEAFDYQEFFKDEKQYKHLLKTIMIKIESGDFEYFYSNIDKLNTQIVSDLLFFCSKKEYVKDLLADSKLINKIGFNHAHITSLLISTEDSNHIKSIIEDKEKIEEYDLDHNDIANLIIATKDSEYIKGILGDKEKIEEYKLNNHNIADLIVATKDSEYIKGILEDDKKITDYDLNGYNIEQLIIATNDKKYITSKIEDEKRYHGYLHICGPISIPNLVVKLNDTVLNKKIINSPLELESYEFFMEEDHEALVQLLCMTKKTEELIEILISKEKREELKLSDTDIANVIKKSFPGFQDLTSILIKYLSPEELINIIKNEGIYGISNDDMLILLLKANLEKDIDEYIESHKNKKEYNETIDLPEDMTIGLEIESEGKHSINIRILESLIDDKWKSKYDGSVSDGVEVISPILTGDTEKTTSEIKKVCQILNILRTRGNN